MNFNELYYRYLPANLKSNLEEPPTRYEIYPKFKVDEDSFNKDNCLNILDPQKIVDFLEDWSS